MQLWGVTGVMGSGKSQALGFLKARSCPVIDTDEVSRQVVDPNEPEGPSTLLEIQKQLGEKCVLPNGTLDRSRLRQLIASSSTVRGQLEKLLHPKILARVLNWSAQHSKSALGFVEGTRLIESGLTTQLKGLIVVTAPEELRVARIVARDHSTPALARALLATQNEALMKNHATVLWDNSSTQQALEQQIDAFLNKELHSS